MELLKQLQATSKKSLFETLLENKDHAGFKGAKVHEFLELIEQALDFACNNKVADVLSFLYKNSGYETKLMTEENEDRIDNVNELLNSIKKQEEEAGEPISLFEYIQNISLLLDNDEKDEEEKVKLMTAHISKGQEFPYVFVCALNEGNFPSNKASTSEKVEEERRLAYVAFTRAEKGLYLSDAEGYDYVIGEMIPSRFLFDIEKEEIKWEGQSVTKSSNDYKTIENSKFNFDKKINLNKGARVSHRFFGMGTIQDINEQNNEYIIKFDLFTSVRNISFDCMDLNLEKKAREEIDEKSNDIISNERKEIVIQQQEKAEKTTSLTIDDDIERYVYVAKKHSESSHNKGCLLWTVSVLIAILTMILTLHMLWE